MCQVFFYIILSVDIYLQNFFIFVSLSCALNINLKLTTMKLIKGILVIAVMSALTFSCDQAKKESATDAIETAAEATEEAAVEAVEAVEETAEQVIDSVSAQAEKVIDSAQAMAEGVAKKCEGKCSKDGKSCDGSCKA